VTIKKWLAFYWSAVWRGTVASLIAGLLLIALFDDFVLMEMSEPGFNWQTIYYLVMSGSAIATLSHAGFFSYLIVRDVFLGILRSYWVWDRFQLLLVAVVFEAVAYWRWKVVGDGQPFWEFMILPGVVLAIAIAVAVWKMKLTNRHGFVPTLFFMFVGTMIEAIPALRYPSLATAIYMLVPLIVCNTWQIMMLPRFSNGGKSKKSPQTGSSQNSPEGVSVV